MRTLVATIALLAAGCDIGVGNQPKGKAPPVVEDAQIFRAQLEMRTLAAEVEQHHALRGEWPADWRTLKRSGMDPWGNEYVFEIDGEKASVFSAGRDGEFGTDDDLQGP